MTTTTTRRTTPSPETSLPRTTDPQRRNRQLGLLLTGGVAVVALATGAVVWAASGNDQHAHSTLPSGGLFSTASAGALVGHGTAVVPADAPVANDAAAGALVGHGTTLVVATVQAPVANDAEAGALVGNTRS